MQHIVLRHKAARLAPQRSREEGEDKEKGTRKNDGVKRQDQTLRDRPAQISNFLRRGIFTSCACAS
jgi:hypothetical protein